MSYPTPTPAPLPPGVMVPGMMPHGASSPELTPSPFGVVPPKRDERRPFALWLVVLGAIVLALVVGVVIGPRLAAPGDDAVPAAPEGVGVVVVGTPTASAVPTTAVVPSSPIAPASAIAAPPTLDDTSDGEGPSTHRSHRHPVTAAETTHVETAASPPVPPPPTSAPAPSAGDGYLSLITSPWTHVTEGGHDLGDTPLVRVPLSAGHHTLHLVNTEAGIRETYDVEITAGQTTSRRLGLQ